MSKLARRYDVEAFEKRLVPAGQVTAGAGTGTAVAAQDRPDGKRARDARQMPNGDPPSVTLWGDDASTDN